jgi:hypothetical protein
VRTIHGLLVLLVLLLSFVPSASAQSEADKTTARALAIEGQKALESGDFTAAVDKFSRAEKLYHAPTLLVGLGRAYGGLGKYVEAMESFNSVIREELPDNATAAFKKAIADAQQEVQGLDEKIAWVTITVVGPDEPVVSLDGASVSIASLGVKRAVNPGDHELAASADGYKKSDESFSIVSGETKDVSVTLVAAPGEKAAGGDTGGDDDGGDSIMPILGWTAIGIGGAGLVLGGIMGVLAIGKHGDLEEACSEGACPDEQSDTLDSYRTFGTVSTIGFIVGGVFAAGGVVLLLTAPSSDGADTAGDLSIEVGVGHANATLRF